MSGHSKIKVGSDRNFGAVFTGAFTVIGLLPLLHGGDVRLWSFAVAGAFLIPTIVRPRILHPLNLLWFRFGLLLGRVVTPVVMTALFVVAFVPGAIILRLTGKDPLRRRIDRAAASYWIVRDHNTHPMGSMKNQF